MSKVSISLWHSALQCTPQQLQEKKVSIVDKQPHGVNIFFDDGSVLTITGSNLTMTHYRIEGDGQ